MRLTRIYVRFYKSFNYDYERKFTPGAVPDPWEMIGDVWYPFVRLDLEPSITTIVGANEAGKSHLLNAIEKVITGEGIELADFCRYSHFFSVEVGKRRSPDFGAEIEVTAPADVSVAKATFGLELEVGQRFHLFRINNQAPEVWALGATTPTKVTKADKVRAALPGVFRLDPDTPLPDSIPLYELTTEAHRSHGTKKSRRKLQELILGRPWSSPDEFTRSAPSWYSELDGAEAPSNDGGVGLAQQYDLARALLFQVANIDPTTFNDLSDAIADGKEGYANAVIQKINGALATYLNFPRWWAQDREFRLLVSRSEYDLVFTIRDRTGTEYSFAERSNGLKYFLSYHVQLLAHQPPDDDGPEILLMDEPDAYLSSQGQQDLLRILEEFATPEDRSRADQVVYVTHSPFLINRNSAERIRVLDKGSTDEGTRVVKDVARNHYEPLRSSLGAFVAETSFIGGSNLFVEGLADQVLLAGLSSHLRAIGTARIDTLDLNSVTIVPAGSASTVPYLVYLARGRDVTRPPCVVLLDSDAAGDDAVRALKRGGARSKEVLPARFVRQVGALVDKHKEDIHVAAGVPKVEELEDLVALPVAVAAARNYAHKVGDFTRETADRFTSEDIEEALKVGPGTLFDAVAAAFTSRFGSDTHIEKVGFAKEVVAALRVARSGPSPEGFEETERNFALVLADLAKLLREASAEEQDRRLNNRLDRTVSGFLRDYPNPASRERGRLLIEEVEASTEDSEAGDRIRLEAERIRREFALDENLTDPIERFEDFRDRVASLRYEERFTHQQSKTAVPIRSGPDLVGAGSPDSGSTGGLPSEADFGSVATAEPAISTATDGSGKNG